MGQNRKKLGKDQFETSNKTCWFKNRDNKNEPFRINLKKVGDRHKVKNEMVNAANLETPCVKKDKKAFIEVKDSEKTSSHWSKMGKIQCLIKLMKNFQPKISRTEYLKIEQISP